MSTNTKAKKVVKKVTKKTAVVKKNNTVTMTLKQASTLVAALEKAGKSITSMSDEEKKKFFNKIDAAWKAKGEKRKDD